SNTLPATIFMLLRHLHLPVLWCKSRVRIIPPLLHLPAQAVLKLRWADNVIGMALCTHYVKPLKTVGVGKVTQAVLLPAPVAHSHHPTELWVSQQQVPALLQKPA